MKARSRERSATDAASRKAGQQVNRFHVASTTTEPPVATGDNSTLDAAQTIMGGRPQRVRHNAQLGRLDSHQVVISPASTTIVRADPSGAVSATASSDRHVPTARSVAVISAGDFSRPGQTPPPLWVGAHPERSRANLLAPGRCRQERLRVTARGRSVFAVVIPFAFSQAKIARLTCSAIGAPVRFFTA
jgi:hypothetical protein